MRIYVKLNIISNGESHWRLCTYAEKKMNNGQIENFKSLLEDIQIAKNGALELPMNTIHTCAVYVLYLEEADIYYVGSSVKLRIRHETHRRTLARHDHVNRLLQREYNRLKDPVLRIVYVETKTAKEARDFEQVLLDKYFQTDLLANLWSKVCISPDNRVSGMEGRNHSEKTKELLRLKNKEQFSDPEARKRQSEITKEKLKNPDLLTRMKAAQKEGIEKWKSTTNVSARQKSFWDRPGHREKHREACSGRFIRVRIDGVEYDSVKAAGRAVGLSNFGVKHRIESGKFPGWEYIQT